MIIRKVTVQAVSKCYKHQYNIAQDNNRANTAWITLKDQEKEDELKGLEPVPQ